MRCLVLLGLVACGGTNAGSSDAASGDAPAGSDAGGDAEVDAGVVVSDCPVGTWCVEDAPADVDALIHTVGLVDATDVFAVGDEGTILRRQNGAWTRMTSGTTVDLRGLAVLSSTDVWAAGEDGTVLHFDGTAWTDVPGGPATVDYAAAWGAAANDVWFVGTGTAVHWNGSALSNGSVVTGVPVAISGVASNDIWVAAETGRLSHYTTSWQLTTPMVNGSSPGNSYFAVYARATDDVWASTPGVGTIRWNGSTWSAHAAGTTLFAAIYASASDRAWGVGGTKVGAWDGAAWTISTPVTGLASSLYGVAGVGPHLWAVGDNGTLLYHHD